MSCRHVRQLCQLHWPKSIVTTVVSGLGIHGTLPPLAYAVMIEHITVLHLHLPRGSFVWNRPTTQFSASVNVVNINNLTCYFLRVSYKHAGITPWRQNPKVHHRIHNSPPPVPVLSQLDPIYTPPANLLKIHSDPILSSTPWSSKWSLSFWISHQNPVRIPLLSHACHMSFPPHSPWFDLPNNICGGVRAYRYII
jgi:hypothetical protein